MKKEERLYRLFGDIDDELVADAARKPAGKKAWIPLVAAAACVALTVALWQGNPFEPTLPLVDEPSESTGTTERAEEPTTANPTTDTSTTEKSTEPSKSEPTKTTEPSKTTEPTKPYILVGGEEDPPIPEDEMLPHLENRLVSKRLETKMEEYRNVNAVFQVVVSCVFTNEDHIELEKIVDASEEYQSLQKQYNEARKAKEEASDRLHESVVNNDDAQIQAALVEKFRKAEELYYDLSRKCDVLQLELGDKYMESLREKRISYATKYSKTEPIGGYDSHFDKGNGYYMELTAEAINELADKGGYSFYLASASDEHTIPGIDCE